MHNTRLIKKCNPVNIYAHIQHTHNPEDNFSACMCQAKVYVHRMLLCQLADMNHTRWQMEWQLFKDGDNINSVNCLIQFHCNCHFKPNRITARNCDFSSDFLWFSCCRVSAMLDSHGTILDSCCMNTCLDHNASSYRRCAPNNWKSFFYMEQHLNIFSYL